VIGKPEGSAVRMRSKLAIIRMEFEASLVTNVVDMRFIFPTSWVSHNSVKWLGVKSLNLCRCL
jgi:hypothetical protein